VVSVKRFWSNNPLLKREKLLRFFLLIKASVEIVDPISWSRHRSWSNIGMNSEKFTLVDSFREQYMVFTGDQVISREIYLRGEFDFLKLHRAWKFLQKNHPRSNKVLLDVGANLGSICIPAIARGYFETAIAIEADPVIAECLYNNIILNHLENRVMVHAVAAGPRGVQSTQFVLDDENYGSSHVVNEANASKSVSVRSIDELVPNPSEVGLVFIDVEGYEGNVLLGASNLISLGTPIALEFSPKLVANHMPKTDFVALLQRYSGFISLNDPLQKFYPIGELAQIWEDYLTEDENEQTDLLFICSKPLLLNEAS
jgi:FkbM family methyltransferase